jgi:acetyl esterase/lipase
MQNDASSVDSPAQRLALWAMVSALLAFCCVEGQGEEPPLTYQLKEGLAYRTGSEVSDYMKERCLLDIYYPENAKKFATIIWFHGGGLRQGERFIPAEFKNQGLAVVAPGYRLTPKVKAAACIEDAAAAVAWVFQNIESYGGDPSRIFVSGHSAGGYLTSMVGLDKRWLSPHKIDPNRIAGLIPYSGHTITHMAVRDERGIPNEQAVVDEFAPLFHVRKDAPPMLLITGDRNFELLGRYEENAYFWRMMKVAGNETCQLFELQGSDHGQMVDPAHDLCLRFIKKIIEPPKKK